MVDWIKSVQTAQVWGQATEIGHLRGDISGLQQALKIKQQEVEEQIKDYNGLVNEYNDLSRRFNALLDDFKAVRRERDTLRQQMKEVHEADERSRDGVPIGNVHYQEVNDERLSLRQDKEHLSQSLASEQHLSRQLQAAQARLIDPQQGLYNWCAAQLELLHKRLVVYLLTRDSGQSKDQFTLGDPALVAQLSLEQRREGNMRLLGGGAVFWEAFVRSPWWLRGVIEHGTRDLLKVVAEQGVDAGETFLTETMLPTADQALALALDQTRLLGNHLAGEEGLDERSERCFQAARKDLEQGILRFKKGSPEIVCTRNEKGAGGFSWAHMLQTPLGQLTQRFFFPQ